MKKPKLTIDIGPLFDSQWTGIPVFTRRLVQALVRDGRLDLSFCFNGFLVPMAHVVATLAAGSGVALQDEFDRNAAKHYPRIAGKGCLLYPSLKRTCGLAPREASTVHDLSTLFMPENHEESNVSYHIEPLRKELATDEVVFCASESTRAALITAFPSVAAKTRVLYPYVEWPAEFDPIERNLPRLQIGRYAVVVGTLEPRKNLSLILNTLSSQEIIRSDIKFVVIGGQGWLMKDFLAEITPPQRERLLFTGFVSEFSKYRLMKNCEFLVYPSLYEGFGIPALEALSLGKPVLAARTSSFPEVVGDAGVYFDPLSVSEFAAAFDEIQSYRKLSELATKTITQSVKFDWLRTANSVVDWVCGSPRPAPSRRLT